jgi:hypothetical protein
MQTPSPSSPHRPIPAPPTCHPPPLTRTRYRTPPPPPAPAPAARASPPPPPPPRPLPLQENRRKQQRNGFLNTLLQHAEEFKVFHRETRRTGHKLAKSVLQDFESKARRENKERERAQRERIKALRDNNLDEYMKLINDTKNERIQALLAETDNYLHELGDKVRQQKDSIKQTNGASSSGGAAGGDSAEGEAVEGGAEPPPVAKGESHSERSAYNALTHSVTEEIELTLTPTPTLTPTLTATLTATQP